MGFIIYDISLLALFIIFISIFLYRKRKNLKREGLLLLYRTKKGIKIINNIGKKHKKALKVLGYFSIVLGYFLMVAMFYLFIRIVWVYLFQPSIVRAIKIPPIMPLIPYLPQIFKLDFLPPFYFTYWIIIIAIIAITHEFAHGIFAAYNKVKIKNTGFGFFPFFLPIFLAAFVELDEKKMAKKKKLSQLSILSAGTFANLLTAIFFFFILWGFLSIAFMPAGITFDTYSYSLVSTSSINSVNGIPLGNTSYENFLEILNKTEKSEINVGNETYLMTRELLNGLIKKPEYKKHFEFGYAILYDDSPAINAELKGAIIEINEMKIDSREKLTEELKKYSPGDEIKIITETENGVSEYNIILEEHPQNKNLPWLGIGFLEREDGVIWKMINFISIKKPNVYYKPKFPASLFIYNLLLWITIISLSVALINMLPVGIFDGGRFLFLTALAITKSEKKARNFFSFLTYLILFLVLLIMVFWFLTRFKIA